MQILSNILSLFPSQEFSAFPSETSTAAVVASHLPRLAEECAVINPSDNPVAGVHGL